MAERGTQDQLELEEFTGADSRRPQGRVERAVRAAVKAAADAGELGAIDGGAAEAAAALARGLDLAVGRADPYAVAAMGKPVTEALARLHLDPASRGVASDPEDPWAKLQREMREELDRAGGQDVGHRPA